MKSTRVFKILSIALAAAVVFYFLVQGVRYLTNPYATTRVYTSTTEDAVEASGWLVREEETFRTDAETLSPTREEGEKVGQGQVIAATYDSPGALEAVAQIQAKRLQLEQLEYALSSYLNPDAALKLDGSISDDIIALRKNLTGGDYTAASGDLSQLKAAIVKRSRAYTSSQEIKAEITAVQDEIDSLQAGLTGAANITAPRAGTYSAVCDGYESVLTPAGLGDLTPGALDKLAAGENTANVGKLIYGNTWYYAAAVTQEEAQRIAGCGSVSLRLTKGITDDIATQVYSVGPAKTAGAWWCCSAGSIWRRPPSCGTRRPRSCSTATPGCACPPCACGSRRAGSWGFTAPRAASPGSSRWTWCTREMTMCWCRCPRTPTDWTPCVPGTRSS